MYRTFVAVFEDPEVGATSYKQRRERCPAGYFYLISLRDNNTNRYNGDLALNWESLSGPCI